MATKRLEAVEASELGFAPGHWPLYLTYHGRVFQRINPGVYGPDTSHERGELLYYVYETAVTGDRLQVFND